MENRTKDPYSSIRLANQLCFPLYACAKEVVRQYREPLEALNLTYTQYIVMMALWEFGEMSEKELGTRVHLDSGTLTPLLKRLENQGLLTRTRRSDDERHLQITLTEAGDALKEKALQVPTAMQGCVPLPVEDLYELKKLLDKALEQMTKQKGEKS